MPVREFALEAPIAQARIERLEVEAEVIVETARTRSRRLAKEGGVAIERRDGTADPARSRLNCCRFTFSRRHTSDAQR